MAASRSIRFGLSVVMILAVAAGAEATAPPASAGTPTWSIEPSPNVPKRLQTDSLRSVSCVSRASCIAVGYYSKATGGKDHTLVEAWNGSAWSIVRSPNTRAGLENYLISVSCTSASSCVAVGGSGKGRLTMTLIEVWNGSEWSIVSSPDVLGAESSDLNSVSCTASSCVAAGISEPRKGPPQPLIESWNGSVWSIVPTPTLLNGGTGALLGVSCSKPTACVAVGTADTSGSSQTLVESWNGSTWSVVPSPNFPDGQVSILDGVSCSRPRACMAVGERGTWCCRGATDRVVERISVDHNDQPRRVRYQSGWCGVPNVIELRCRRKLLPGRGLGFPDVDRIVERICLVGRPESEPLAFRGGVPGRSLLHSSPAVHSRRRELHASRQSNAGGNLVALARSCVPERSHTLSS